MLEITVKFRKRREEGRDNLQQIKANMETVYNVQGQGSEGETSIGKSLKYSRLNFEFNLDHSIPIFSYNI